MNLIYHHLRSYIRASVEVARRSPKQLPITVWRLLMARARHRAGPEAFFLYRMNERPSNEWSTFMPMYPAFVKAIKAINWRSDRYLADDKIRTDQRCQAFDIPTIPVLAIVGKSRQVDEAYPSFSTESQIEQFLVSRPLDDDLFVKPVRDFGGKGLIALSRRRGIWMLGEEVESVGEIARRLLESSPEHGLLVQPRVQSHPGLAPIGGTNGLLTCRIIVANTKAGPKLVCAALKLTAHPSLADNFSGGFTGNMLAKVELTSGRIEAVYGRLPGDRFVLSNISTHPTTGETIVGRRVPDWDRVCCLSHSVAAAFPEFPLAGLDIAVAKAGPLLVETNLRWDCSLPQIIMQQGIKRTMMGLLPALMISEEERSEVEAILGI